MGSSNNDNTKPRPFGFLFGSTPPALAVWQVACSMCPGSMICVVRMTLIGEYSAATTAHARNASELHKRTGVSSKHEYDLLRNKAEVSRHEAATVYDALKRHLSEHGPDEEPVLTDASQIVKPSVGLSSCHLLLRMKTQNWVSRQACQPIMRPELPERTLLGPAGAKEDVHYANDPG